MARLDPVRAADGPAFEATGDREPRRDLGCVDRVSARGGSGARA